MKNIFKLFFAISITSIFLVSCDEEIAFDAMTSAPDASAGYYLQFINAAQSFETGVTEAGGLVEIEKPIGVVLMGMPQSQDIQINLAVDPSSTFGAGMYTLSSNSITIPAGKTSGSVTFKTIAAKMPVGQTLKLVLKIDAGEHNSPNPTAIQLTYNVKRIEFCPLVNGAADLVGSWSGDDAFYNSSITTVLEGTDLEVSGMSNSFIADWWGEPVVSGGSCTMIVKGNGKVEIPRQYIYTTIYDGANYDYEIQGSGKWENCAGKPRLLITYDIYYPGDEKGLAATYSSYLDGATVLTADITLD